MDEQDGAWRIMGVVLSIFPVEKTGKNDILYNRGRVKSQSERTTYEEQYATNCI